MKLHRFYVQGMHNKYGEIALAQEVWIHDSGLLHQWQKVLRYHPGDRLILFNDSEERMYEIVAIPDSESTKLHLITDIERQLHKRQIFLLWTVLKKDKNDWIFQKATELGVHAFVPILSERSEKTGLSSERARSIIIEASEQCGRSDIPQLREPVSLSEAVSEYSGTMPLYVCEQSKESEHIPDDITQGAVLIGPEGGWSDKEKELFSAKQLPHISLSPFTLRAETAAILAVSRLLV